MITSLFVSKELLDQIWQDKKCRAPLSRVRWTREELPGSTQEAPGLFYVEGGRTAIKRNRADGQNSK